MMINLYAPSAKPTVVLSREKSMQINALHAAAQTERCRDSCEDCDYEVDDGLPHLFLLGV